MEGKVLKFYEKVGKNQTLTSQLSQIASDLDKISNLSKLYHKVLQKCLNNIENGHNFAMLHDDLNLE